MNAANAMHTASMEVMEFSFGDVSEVAVTVV